MKVVSLFTSCLYTARRVRPLLVGRHRSSIIHFFFFLTGNFDAFMQKEIFEQPETVVNTMRGRICFDSNTGDQNVFSSFKDLTTLKDFSTNSEPNQLNLIL